MSPILASPARMMRQLAGCLLIVTGVSGCYLSHSRPEPRGDGAVVVDAGADAGTDAGMDAGRDAGPRDGGLPDSAVTRPCTPGDPAPLPGGEPPPPCAIAGAGDHDGDGFANDVDCNDCSPQINPGAYDFPGNGVDEDCDGADDAPCDDRGLPVAPRTVMDATRAMGLCRETSDGERSWGVLSARFTTADGVGEPASPFQIGVLESFGRFRPVRGASMLALSSGLARAPEGAGEAECRNYGGRGGFAPGFPLESPACPGVSTGPVHDPVALEVRLRVPTNVTAFQMASAFYTHEYPDFICSSFNDVFAVLQPRGGALENIVFDSAGNPITVNNALLSVCRPGVHGGVTFECPGGYGPLFGSGYEVDCPAFGGSTREGAGASTGCLTTVSRVTPGEVITLRFAIWDSGDGELDSLALIDGFEWIGQPFLSVAP